MDRLRLLFLAAFTLVATLLTGCGANVAVIRQAEPNPFVGSPRFQVAPLETKGLLVGEMSEEQYLASKDEAQRASFQEDKAAMAERFQAGFAEAVSDAGLAVANDAPFVVRPRLVFVEPGFYAVLASAPSQARMRVAITTPDGKVLDEIELAHSTDSKSGMSVGGISTNPSSGGRLRDDAAAIGEAVGAYLAERAGR